MVSLSVPGRLHIFPTGELPPGRPPLPEVEVHPRAVEVSEDGLAEVREEQGQGRYKGEFQKHSVRHMHMRIRTSQLCAQV